ncbi:hypothetical protein PPTG_23171 [Phytophthora nicotianae INRA-310]|uniref:Cytochrome P450 n=1 Tax=Phytophthora nicotianae (strain INRA-310) TaxID=761204 RepID=W2Q2F9_PHYN3|nr:hypothetical protein PPTG_23171 [Phytophthora nicotianae INRA-310]ETN07353.1 hypothetical protein PPTG_23171 [Phytophthora nicotianae INRA-310]
MVLPFAIAASFIAAAVAYFTSPNDQDRAVCELPTPRSTLPLVKNTLDLVFIQRARIYDWILEQCREHRGQPWRVRVLGRPPAVILSSPEAMEDVLKTQFDVFIKGPTISDISHGLLGDGIFVVDGIKWKHQRKTASNFFSMNMIRDAMENVVRDHSKLLTSTLNEAVENGETLNIKRVLDLFTMDIFTKIGFGVELHGLETGGNSGFMEAFERASSRIMARFQQPMCMWKLARWLNVGAERQMAKDVKLINDVVYDVIHRNLEEKASRKRSGENSNSYRKDLISLFLEKASVNYSDDDQTEITPTMLRDMSMLAEDIKVVNDLVYGVISRSIDEKNRQGVKENSRKDLITLFIEKSEVEYTKGVHTKKDLKLMRDFVISFLAAGRETTATTMSWVILMLNRYPKVLERVRHEIKDKLPDLVSGNMRSPTLEDTQQLVYLEAVVRETLRLFPVAAVSGRSATRDVRLYEGTLIKAGTRIVLPHYCMGRMTTVWGPDVDEFKPERWIDPISGKIKMVSPFKFSVFFGGPRICLGMKFALAEVKITLAKLLSQFDFKTVKDPFDFTYRASITLQIKGPFDVVVSRLKV